MSKVRIRLSGNWPAWNRDVRMGRLTGSDGVVRQVLIHLRRDLANDADGRTRARRDGRVLAELDDPGMLRIFHVSTLEDQVAEVSEFFRCASLATLLECLEAHGETLHLRTAVELIAEVAGVLAGVLGGAPDTDFLIIHTGVTPHQVLIDDGGNLKLTGFSVHRPDDEVVTGLEGYTPPEGFVPGGSAYGLGALLSELLTGDRPPGARTDPSHQGKLVSELMVAILARSGATVPDEVTNLVRTSLSAEVKTRPRLGSLANELRDLARTLEGPNLRAWAAGLVPGVLAGTGLTPPKEPEIPLVPRIRAPFEDTRSLSPTESLQNPPESDGRSRAPLPVGVLGAAEGTVPDAGLSQLQVMDDPTQSAVQGGGMDDEPTVKLSREDLQPLLKRAAAEADAAAGKVGLVADHDLAPGRLGVVLHTEERESHLGIRPESDGPRGGARPPRSGRRGPLLFVAVLFLVAGMAMIALHMRDQQPEEAPEIEEEETLSDRVSGEFDEPAEGASEDDGGSSDASEEPEGDPEPVDSTRETAAPREAELPVELPAEPTAEPTIEEVPEPAAQDVPEPTAVDVPETEVTDGEESAPSDASAAGTPIPDESSDPELVEASSETPSEDEEGPEEDVFRIAPAQPDETSETTETEPVEASAVPTRFEVEFHSMDAAIVTLEVKCSEGFGFGPSPLTVEDLGPGPCVVRSRFSDGNPARTAHVSLKGSAIFYCFEEGQASCRSTGN